MLLTVNGVHGLADGENRMFESWGRVMYRRRRLVLAVALIVVAVAAVWGTGVFGRLQSSGGFTPPDSQSQQEANLAAARFGRDAGDVVVLYSSPASPAGRPPGNALSVRSTAFRDAVTGTLERLPRSRVESVASYWSTGSPQFVSASGHQTYVVLELTGVTDGARQASYDAIKGQLDAPGLRTQIGGVVPTNEAIGHEVTADIGRAEAISLPVLLILMLVIFGGLVAAGLPVAIGGIAILGSFTALRLLTLVTSVSTYSINITTIMGLGLGIDYGLFLVSRFREELHRQGPGERAVEDAVARTVATAGRTVAVSGITVATALASLMLFPMTFLRSMGYGGVATVAVDLLAALTVLPALLAVLGPKVNALRIRRGVPPATAASKAVAGDLPGFAVPAPRTEGEGGWYRLASSVMRRPLAYAVPIVVVLLALGSPFLRITWGGTDAAALPASAPQREVTEALNRDFPGNPTAPIESIVQFSGPVAGAPAREAGLASYVSRLDRVPGVTAAQVTGVRGATARVDVRYETGPYSPQARAIVGQVRNVPAPAGAVAYVGGQSAGLVDELSALGSVLPWMGLVVALATFVLLFLAFGSVVLPVKAIVMNVLSLSAMYGVLVWIFQEGHLSGLLRFTPTGTIDPSMPILLFAIMFGLSMDYEVFLLSRIRERYDVTGDNTAAVASGLQRTGGLITSLALLLVIVVGAFSASGITFIKLLGVGMIVALIVDATVVRVLLVPAVMRLLGPVNWWAPRPLRRLYARYGLREADQNEVDGPARPRAGSALAR
jgi:trehalose monomycolate/heme transporter